VGFRDTPLETAVADLAEKTGIDIRLDLRSLRDARIRERQPVTLTLGDCKLQTVLQAMLMELDLGWALRHGVLWVGGKELQESNQKTAVYDVRDLCRDEDESESLREAVTSQASPQSWQDVGGMGSVRFAKPGTMIVFNEERILFEVFELLETYRTALRSSKPRGRGVDEDQQITTVYYRMPPEMATDLADKLPELVPSDLWRNDSRPEAPGTILRIASAPEFGKAAGTGQSATGKAARPGAQPMSAPYSVLIVTQSWETHRAIAEVIRRVETGDPMPGAGGMRATGDAFGGFGGGFFSVPAERAGRLSAD